jgi:uncharacterized protein
MSSAALPSDPLNELDAYLVSERSPENCMAVSDLDGFLTAIAVGPGLIAPARWLPVVWGGDTPHFADAAEEARITAAIMGRYNEIVRLMASDPEGYEPIFWETPEGTAVVGDWCEGFADAMRLAPEEWQPLIESEAARDLLVPILAFVMDEDGDTFLDRAEGDAKELEGQMAELIKPSVIAIAEFWHQRQGRA